MDSLRAAVSNGADAVYFGGSLFNARLGAKNFDNSEMTEALDFCHFYGVKCYITMNTLTHDRDLLSALRYASFLYEHGADALIIQDLGLFSLIKKYIPAFEMHASTQTCISTLEGVQKCAELGFDRVVLSRELSLSDVSYICSNSNMPIEVFVHGAMCMSFSGGCLFSSMVGGRSGNCGTCAQPCRKYMAVGHMPDKNELCLSLSDLCMIEHVDELQKAGVMSLKIEGRMKKPEYIACVTNAYRRAIDGASVEEIRELKRELFAVFNRGEFSAGYYFGDDAKTDRTGSATDDSALTDRILRRNVLQPVRIDLSLKAHAGKSAVLTAVTDFGTAEVTGIVTQQPAKPVTEQTIARANEQLSKLGGTGFAALSVNSDITGFIPVSAINEMRRKACERLVLLKALRREAPVLPDAISLPEASSPEYTQTVSAKVYSADQARAAYEAGADEIILEYGEFTRAEILLMQKYRDKAKLGIALPITLLRGDYDKMREIVSPNDFDAVEINNLGQLDFAKQFPHVYGGYHLNCFNAHTANMLTSLGIERLTLSVELNPAQVREIRRVIPDNRLMLHAYGRVVLMNLYHCPIKEHIGCAKCGAAWQRLYDADGRSFPTVGTRAVKPCAVTRLFNCLPHDLFSKLDNMGHMNIGLCFTDEKADIVKDRIECGKQGGRNSLPDTTRGYFNR